jgi:cytochrome c
VALTGLLALGLAGLLWAAWGDAGSDAPAPGLALARGHGCLSCHGLVHKQVGPGYAQVAQRYRGDPEAPERLAAIIRAGSVGRWGRVIMPRQPGVTEAEARQLAAWVLSQVDPETH